MTGALGWRLVVFSQVSAFLPCWVVRSQTIRAERFARIAHAPDVVPVVANTLRPPGHRYRGVSRTGRRGFRLRNSRAALNADSVRRELLMFRVTWLSRPNASRPRWWSAVATTRRCANVRGEVGPSADVG
jgi:hypothetical protein